MLKKFLIVTDERTGCTEFTEYFKLFDLKTEHDPNSILSNKNHDSYNKLREIIKADVNNVEDLYSDLFKIFDVIKICFISYSIDKLKRILKLSNVIGFTIIFIYKDPYKRALSKCIAAELTHQCRKNNHNNLYSDGYSNNIYPFYKKFKIDINVFSNQYNNFISKLSELLQLVYNDDLEHVFVDINKFYNSLSFSKLQEFFSSINLKINHDIFIKLTKRIQDYSPVNKNKFVINCDELEEKYKDKFSIPLYLLKKSKYSII